MPMHQNFHFTLKASLEEAVEAIDKIMNNMQWHISQEFSKYDMSTDYKRKGARGLFGRQNPTEKQLEMDVTIRYQDAGGKIVVYLLSTEALGDAVAAAKSPPDPERRKLLQETHRALTDGLRAKNFM